MPELDQLVFAELERQGAVKGPEIVQRLTSTGQHGAADVSQAVWRLLDSGRVRLTWDATLDVVQPTPTRSHQ